MENIRKYRFEFRHLTILFAVLIAFQIILSIIHNVSLRSFLGDTQDWYQKDSAEKFATVTATSLELLVETINPREPMTSPQLSRIVQSVDIILSQQLLGRNAKEVCVLITKGGHVYAINDGQSLVAVLSAAPSALPPEDTNHQAARAHYRTIRRQLQSKEEVVTLVEGKQTFHTFVPFVPNGECLGAVYVKNEPDFRVITSSLASNYSETSVLYSALMFLGLLAMFFVSSYTARERDQAQRRFYEEHAKLLSETITHEKESVFTRRIYHTHHKAEKVMAFVKQDLDALNASNIDTIRHRIAKYANFVSRVIYDMKWYEPAIQTIRNPAFNTDINEVIRFLVENLFLRVAKVSSRFDIVFDLDERVPHVGINEFVIWEIVEPLIQNSLMHAHVPHVHVCIASRYAPDTRTTLVTISDNGAGIRPDLLEKDGNGIQRIFLENVSTVHEAGRNSGYGCFIAFDLAKNRCGWDLAAENLPVGGCRLTITIHH